MCAAVSALLAALSGCVLSAGPPEDEAPPAGDEEQDLGPDAGAEPVEEQEIDCDAAPVSTATSVPAYTTTESIAIDGALGEATWAAAATVTFSNPTLSDNSTSVAVLWDQSALYVAFTVSDAELQTGGEAVFRDDGAELYFDTLHDATEAMNEDDHHFISNIAGDLVGGAINVATTEIAGGYIHEMAIPWAEISMTAPAPDTVIGLLLGNNDRDGGVGVQYDWQALIDSGDYSRPNLWGDLIISDFDATACAP